MRGSDSENLIAETPPVRMVDRLQIAEDGRSAVGVKAVSMDETFFQGHFPGGPIMPGVLQLAAMCQLGGALMRKNMGASIHPWLTALKRVKFRRPVVPGDMLRIEATVKQTDDQAWMFEATTAVGEQKACTANLVLEAREPGDLLPPERPLQTELPEEAANIAADSVAILDMIPHRFPFLLLDRLALMDPPRVIGIKNVTVGEPWFRGLPVPLMPGFFQIEAAAQAACALALTQKINEGKIGYFMSVDRAVFSGPVAPGDQLVMDVDVQQRGRFGIAEARLTVAADTVAETAMKFAIVDAE